MNRIDINRHDNAPDANRLSACARIIANDGAGIKQVSSGRACIPWLQSRRGIHTMRHAVPLGSVEQQRNRLMIFEATVTIRTLRKEGIKPFLKKLGIYLRDLLHGVQFTLGKKPPFSPSAELLAYSFQAAGGLIQPSQVKSEITSLMDILAKQRPKTVVEIGTANGGTLFLFCKLAHPEATVVSIDLPNGIHGGGYPFWKTFLYRQFVTGQQRMHLIRASSRDPKTIAELKATLAGRTIDFLFIDGDHTYEGVKADFENYAPLVSKGGMVAFHDIAEHTRDLDCKVDVFWTEVRSKHRSEQFIQDARQGWGGIGVLYV